MTVIVNKPSPRAVNELYLFDSSNPMMLDKSDEELESLSVENRCWSKIRLGLKPTIKFMVEMSIQSMFDRRNFYSKLCQIFDSQSNPIEEKLTITKVFTSCQINYMLKEFHLQTEYLNPNALNELTLPTANGFSNYHG